MNTKKKLKVLQVNKLYYPYTGGVEQIVQQIAEGLNGRVDMRVLVCRDKGRAVDEIVNGVAVHRAGSFGIALSMPLSLDFVWKFRVMAKSCDVVHIHMPFPLADVAALLSGYKGKIVLWWHSDIVRQKSLMVFYRPFMEWLLRRADLIMVATEGHIEGSAYLGRYADKCAIIPFGVRRSMVAQGAQGVPPAPAARVAKPSRPARKSAKKAPVTILFAGRLIYYKGVDVLIEAFAKTTHSTLRIFGEGPLLEPLKSRAQALGINRRIHFLTDLTDSALSREFANCDFFVLPSVSKSEAFGIVQIEAMSYGKPVINTRLPSGVPYVSIDGETGFTVTPNDADALAAAMQTLIDDAALRKKFGEAAYKRACEEFSGEVMLDRIYKAYEGLFRHT